MPTDPVCGMEVDEKHAPAKIEYRGETYYFCAPGCKNKFEQDPEEFLPGENGNRSEHSDNEH